MILSAQSIRKRVGLIKPFYERTVHRGMTFGLSSAGYDIRIAESLHMWPKAFLLASSMEEFDIPNNLVARVMDKSTWARKGITVQNTICEPGWKGFLTLELTNHSNGNVTIGRGDPIAQIVFELLDEHTEQPYEGKYQNQRSGPVGPITEK